MEPKYKITLQASSLQVLPNPKKKYHILASKIRASDKYDKLFPAECEKDIMYVSLISHSLNHINQNDCLVLGKEGIDTYKTIVNKPLDVEHERTDIVGFCIRSFLTTEDNGSILKKDDALDILKNDGIVNVGAIFAVWKMNFPDLAKTLEDNFNKENENYGKVKASFEYYFDDYDFFLSEGNADFPNGKIIDGSADAHGSMFKLLRINGGNGVFDGNRISIIPKNGFVGGCALTYTPANDLSDVLAMKDTEETIEINNSIETQPLNSVINDMSKHDKDSKEIPEQKVEAAVELTVEKTVVDALKSEMDKKITELDASKNQVESLNKSVTELTANLDKVTKLAEQLQANFDKEVDSRIQKEAEELKKEKAAMIASRVSTLSDIFEVNDSNRSIIEAEVSTLSAEDFDKKVAMYRKISASKVESAPQESVRTVVEEVVAEAAKATLSVDILAAAPSATLTDEYTKAFGDPKTWLKI